jgi:hypothetical protein
MNMSNIVSETRFNRLVLGGWWASVAVLGAVRLWQGDKTMGIVLLASSTFTALLGAALSIDRERSGAEDAPSAEAYRLQKATMLFSLIAITTVVACAFINGAFWWAAFECAALLWILPAVILPLAQAFVRKRIDARTAHVA